jgi:hypothetical protein
VDVCLHSRIYLHELHENSFNFHISLPRLQSKYKKSFAQLGLFPPHFNKYLKSVMLDLIATARARRKIRNSNQNNAVNFETVAKIREMRKLVVHKAYI